MPEKAFTKENLDAYLKDLAKEFRKRNGNKTPAEIVLVGGAAILAGYGFRDMTFDVDATALAFQIYVWKQSRNNGKPPH